MFDKMIVSDANAGESQGRSRYFLVSGLVVGALFLSAVVFSIYAVELDLGTDEFELSMMLAPVESIEPEPPPTEEPQNRSVAQRTDVPMRVVNMQRVDEVPDDVPAAVSVNPNQYLTRPTGRFNLGIADSVGSSFSGEPGRGDGDGRKGSGSSVEPSSVEETTAKVDPPPPPPVTKPKPAPVVSKGVINGRATYLPTPPYPAAARAVNAAGSVSVQVTIDESGKVISAKAIDGHPLLKREAERAAWGAKFSPTKLSEVPVKVTGVIVYNFKR